MVWEISEIDIEERKKLANELNISDFLMTLLLNRGFKEKESIQSFIYPELTNFRDPFDFENMSAVVEKIIDIRNRKSKMFVYGDYDVDGITSAVFLTKAFSAIGIDIEYYIPNRMEEEYGIDRKNLEYMRSKSAELVITVDTSISSIEDIRYGRSIGIDVVITDHHKSAKEKEDDEVLYINPKLSEKYKFKYLSGAGVALKVAQAVYKTLGIEMNLLYNFIEVVMIGTIADVVPIIDENRIIVKEGLKRLKNTEIKGLISLMKYLKFQNKNITTTDISYFISPLINSLGRIGTSKIGADFFMEENESEIYEIIEEMKRSNKRRREYEKKIYEDAIDMLKNDKPENIKGIFLASKKWHPGVIGIVASRLSIKYSVPVVLISLSRGIGKASSRSLRGINIFNIFKSMSHLLIRFGGHDLAAGFIADEDNLEAIQEHFHEEVAKYNYIKEEQRLKVDKYLPIEEIDDSIMNDIEQLSPYGSENPIPVFVDKNLSFEDIKKFGVDQKHFSGTVVKGNRSFSMVGFEMAKYINDSGYQLQKFDIAYFPEKVNFRGVDEIQIKIKDIKVIDDFSDYFKD